MAFYFLISRILLRHFQNLEALRKLWNYLTLKRTFQIIPIVPILLMNTLRAIASYSDVTWFRYLYSHRASRRSSSSICIVLTGFLGLGCIIESRRTLYVEWSEIKLVPKMSWDASPEKLISLLADVSSARYDERSIYFNTSF